MILSNQWRQFDKTYQCRSVDHSLVLTHQYDHHFLMAVHR